MEYRNLKIHLLLCKRTWTPEFTIDYDNLACGFHMKLKTITLV